MKKIILLFCVFILSFNAFSQILDLRVREVFTDQVSIGAGLSYFTFMGDIGSPERYNDFYHALNPGFSVFAETKLTKSIATSVHFDWANLQSFDRDRARDYRFKTHALHFAWNFKYYFDNDIILPSDYVIAPYVSVGMGVIAFNPMSENDVVLDPEKNYEKIGLTLPVTVGAKYKFSPKFHLGLNVNFVISNTDYIDNFTRQQNQTDFLSGHKDAFLSTSLSAHYVIDNYAGAIQNRITCMERYFSSGWTIVNYFGDIETSVFNLRSNAFTFSFEQRLSNSFGLGLQGTFGKLTGINKDPATFNQNLDFQTSLVNGNLGFFYYFDNEYVISRSSIYSPYITLGPGFLQFSPRGDMKNIYDKTYYFWDDGRVMNAPQGTSNAMEIGKDGVYETNLNSSGLYSQNAITVHGGVGLRVKVTRSVSANLQSSLVYTTTDFIDNISNLTTDPTWISTSNDMLWLNTIGVYLDIRPGKCRRSAAVID